MFTHFHAQRFTEARRVDRVVAEVRGKRRPAAGSMGMSGTKDGGPDPRQVSLQRAFSSLECIIIYQPRWPEPGGLNLVA